LGNADFSDFSWVPLELITRRLLVGQINQRLCYRTCSACSFLTIGATGFIAYFHRSFAISFLKQVIALFTYLIPVKLVSGQARKKILRLNRWNLRTRSYLIVVRTPKRE